MTKSWTSLKLQYPMLCKRKCIISGLITWLQDSQLWQNIKSLDLPRETKAKDSNREMPSMFKVANSNIPERKRANNEKLVV
eukprot:15342661-Ditylum_brightwellii.AAC.1